MSDTTKEWTIPKGTIVHMYGIPYWLTEDTVVSGHMANDPEWFKKQWEDSRGGLKTAVQKAGSAA